MSTPNMAFRSKTAFVSYFHQVAPCLSAKSIHYYKRRDATARWENGAKRDVPFLSLSGKNMGTNSGVLAHTLVDPPFAAFHK